MKKTLHYLSGFYGSLLFLSGILKCMGMLNTFKFSIGGMYMTINNPMSTFYIAAVNFVGGFCMAYFAFKTLNYEPFNEEKINSLDASSKPLHNAEELQRFTLLTGFYTVVVCIWLFFRTLLFLGSFEVDFTTYYPLFICVFLYYTPFALVPMVMTFLKLSIYNDIKNRNRTIAFHAKRQKKSV